MRQLLRSCLLGLAAVLATSAHADIVIGHVLPFSGADAAAARRMSAGAKAYIDQVNATGGVAGQRVVYLACDDAGSPAKTVAYARELIVSDHAVGLLAGPGPANLNVLRQSGLARKYSVPLVGAAGGDVGANSGTTARARDAGLIEVALSQGSTAPVVEEFRRTLARYGAAGEQPTEMGLQGYIAAKVMIGGLRLLGDDPVQREFYFLMRHMVPGLSNHLMRRSDTPV